MNVQPALARFGLLFLMGLSLASCGHQAEQGPPPLHGAALGGPFQLIDQDGRPTTDKSFRGRYRAIYFGYSFCPDVCPTTLQVLMQGYRAFAAGSPTEAVKLVPIFVTVDPERDTPAALKTYVAAFGPQLVGLTGSPQAIKAMAKEYGASYSKEVATGAAGSYLMQHTNQVILFGPDGAPIALVPTDQGAKAVADTFGQWVH